MSVPTMLSRKMAILFHRPGSVSHRAWMDYIKMTEASLEMKTGNNRFYQISSNLIEKSKLYSFACVVGDFGAMNKVFT